MREAQTEGLSTIRSDICRPSACIVPKIPAARLFSRAAFLYISTTTSDASRHSIFCLTGMPVILSSARA